MSSPAARACSFTTPTPTRVSIRAVDEQTGYRNQERHVRADQDRQGRNHRRGTGAEQEARPVHRGEPGGTAGDDPAGLDHPAQRTVRRAHAQIPHAGTRVSRYRLGRHLGNRSRCGAAEGDERGSPDAQCRAFDPVYQRRKNQRALVGGRCWSGRRTDPLAQPPGHCRHRLHQRQVGQHPVCLRRPALQPGVRPPDRLLHALHPVRAGGQQGRQDHRRHPGAQQARRRLHRRGRVTPARLHGAGLHRPGERQAVQRRPEHEELQREHAAKHVQWRDHAGRRRQHRHLQCRRPRIMQLR